MTSITGSQFEARFDPSQIDRALVRLAEVHANIADASPAMQRVAVFLDRWNKENFKTQGGKVGGWRPFTYGGRLVPFRPGSRGGRYLARGGVLPPPANAADIATRRGINTNAVLMQDTGKLRMSMLPFHGKTNAGIGSELPYSKYHEEGEGVPRRRMLPGKDEVYADIFEILDNWLSVQIRKGNGS